MISKQHNLGAIQCHTRFEEGCENLSELTSFHLITSSTFVDYHSKLLVIKQMEWFTADNLIKYKIIFSEYGLPNKIASDAGTNFVLEKFENFSEYIMQCHDHITINEMYSAEACINIGQKNYENCYETNVDIEIM